LSLYIVILLWLNFLFIYSLLLRHLLLLLPGYCFYIYLALAFYILNDLKHSVILFSIYSCIFEFILANHLSLALIIYYYHCFMFWMLNSNSLNSLMILINGSLFMPCSSSSCKRLYSCKLLQLIVLYTIPLSYSIMLFSLLLLSVIQWLFTSFNKVISNWIFSNSNCKSTLLYFFYNWM